MTEQRGDRVSGEASGQCVGGERVACIVEPGHRLRDPGPRCSPVKGAVTRNGGQCLSVCPTEDEIVIASARRESVQSQPCDVLGCQRHRTVAGAWALYFASTRDDCRVARQWVVRA